MRENEISVTAERDRAIITLRGEHEAYSADKLARRIEALIDEGLPIAVDLRQASFLDSTVIGVLLASKRHADEVQLEFVLVLGEETGWPVRRLLQVTGLDAAFGVADEVERSR